ncbi:hypothetical protein GCM10027026_45050 [Myroides odoratimimus subsp. xuanwuensis]
MITRRSIALATSALALAVPTLSSCGFDYATDQVYTPAHGVNDRDAGVDVLGAVIVASEDGAGTFIASFSNNSTDEDATVTSFAGAGDDASLTAADFEPIELKPGGFVSLSQDGGFKVEGDFAQGDFVEVVLEFSTGEKAEMKIPVVPNAGDFADLDGPAPEVSETPEPDSETEEH